MSESWGTIGVQVLMVALLAGPIDLLRTDAITSTRGAPTPLLDLINNSIAIIAGGVAFLILVTVS